MSEQVTFPKRGLFGNVASRCYQNGAMTCQLTGARRLHMVLEALLIAVTLAKHLKFNGFKNFEGLGLEPPYGKNPPFLPGGAVFRRITEPDPAAPDADPFGAEDLYAAMLLAEAAEPLGFGRGAKMQSRGQTRFLFFMTLVELLKDIIVKSGRVVTRSEITRAVLALLEPPISAEGHELIDGALEVIDSYMTPGTDNSILQEPVYLRDYGGDLNAFLKWEKIGKSDNDCPNYRQLLLTQRAVSGKRLQGAESLRERAVRAIYG